MESIRRSVTSLVVQKKSVPFRLVLSPPRISNSALVLTIVLSAFLVAIQFNHVLIGTFFDDAHYVILAESLASGQGMHRINEPDMPLEPDFPPGWPLLLTPVVGLFPGSFAAPKLLTFALWLGTIPLFYRLIVKRIPPQLALIAVALTAFNPFLVRLASSTLSEPAFLFFTMLALNLFEDWHENTQQTRKIWLLTAAFICALYATLIRTVGVSLVAAMLLYLFFKASQRVKIFLSTIVLGMALLFVSAELLGLELPLLSNNYANHLSYITSTIANLFQIWDHYPLFISNINLIAAHIVPVFDLRIFYEHVNPTLSLWLSLGLVTVIFFGFFLTLRRYQLTELYVILFFGIFYAWTIYIDKVQPRQLFPALPFLYLYLVIGFDWLRSRLANYSVHLGQWAYAIPTLLIVVSLTRVMHEYRHPIYERAPDLRIGTTWLQENTPPDTIFMAANVPGVYLYARRQTIYPGYEVADQEQYIQDKKVDYILVQPHIFYWDNENRLDYYTLEKLLPILETKQDKYKIVYRNTDHNVTIYKVMNNEAQIQ